MKYKVSELEGALLDAAVAKAEGFDLGPSGIPWIVDDGEDQLFSPSDDWNHAGPIIERERINVGFDDQGGRERGMWVAYIYDGNGSMWLADKHLIAAMRAYVASKFGEEIEL